MANEQDKLDARRVAPVEPLLKWEGPDEDGDYIVTLDGVRGWSLAAHGATYESALARLGESMLMAYQTAPNCISGDPPGSKWEAQRIAAPPEGTLDYVEWLKRAKAIVRASCLWKRFIDGTPLENDLAVWMTDFAFEAVRAAAGVHPPQERT